VTPPGLIDFCRVEIMIRPLVLLLLALPAIPAEATPGHDAPAERVADARTDGLTDAGPDPGADPPTGLASAARPLPFFYDLYSFRGDSGTTDVVASFAVRAGDLERERVDGETRYRFNVTLVVADTARYRVDRADDSVYVRVPHPLGRDHLLYTHVETRARPSTTTVQRVLMFDAPAPGIGQLYTHPFVVPDYGGSALMLSDIALGLPDSEGGWKRGGETVALLPSSHVPGGAFDVFYEIYNMPDGHVYQTDIAVEPVVDADEPVADERKRGDPALDDDGAIHVRFFGESAVGPDGILAELRHMNTPLEAGRHRITVTVTDQETGNTARRSRLLEIRSGREGATLVASCPVAAGAIRPGC
jgi:hypothetical protein